MKIKEAQQIYRANRAELVDRKRKLQEQKKQLEQKQNTTVNGAEIFAEEAATLELSIQETNEIFDENQKILDQLTEQYCSVWNTEVARQQSDVMSESASDMVKIMEVARRIAKGAKVPGKDEQKLMEYSMELYMTAKNMGSMVQKEKQEKYKSLWEEKKKDDAQKYDPQGKAENATVGFDLPNIELPTDVPVETDGDS